jgi:hypothetical protein
VLADSENIRRQFCEKLTRSVPSRLTSTPVKPLRLFNDLVALAETEPKHLTELLAQNRESGRRRLESLLEFWEVVFPAAMELRFTDSAAVEHNLRALHEWSTR